MLTDQRSTRTPDKAKWESEFNGTAIGCSAILRHRHLPTGSRRHIRHRQLNRLSNAAPCHCSYSWPAKQIREIPVNCSRKARHDASVLHQVQVAGSHRSCRLYTRSNTIAWLRRRRDLPQQKRVLLHKRTTSLWQQQLHNRRGCEMAGVCTRQYYLWQLSRTSIIWKRPSWRISSWWRRLCMSVIHDDTSHQSKFQRLKQKEIATWLRY